MSKKRKSVYVIRRIVALILLLCIFVIIITIINKLLGNKNNEPTERFFNSNPVTDVTYATIIEPEIKTVPMLYPNVTSDTATFDNNLVNSEYGVLIDVEKNTILAERNSNERIYPASLTKVMTLIVAVESVDDLNDVFTMTNEILAPLINQDATRAGFKEGEQVKIIDMLYGAILPSGADATVGLAEKISGSEENFVKLMNEKAYAMGLKNTHFVNTSGLHDENHYSTSVDMAMILEYALKNELCRNILSTYQYTTSSTIQHPEGILLESTMFSRMYGTEVENVTILGGKMGYTIEAGNCLASFATKNGKEYIAVTANGSGSYKPIFDSFEIYGNYLD